MTTETTAIALFDEIAAGLAELSKRYKATVVVVDTPERMESAKKSRAEIRGVRYSIKPAHKAAKAQILKDGRAIDSEAKRLVAEVLALEEPYDEAIKAVEQKEKREAEEKARLKAEHVAKIQAEITGIKAVPFAAVGLSADAIQELADPLIGLDTSEYAEFASDADSAIRETLAKLDEMRDTAKAHEKEQARLEADRAEFDRLRAEQEVRAEAKRVVREAEERERAEAEAESRANQAAEDRARREKLEADEQEARERIAEEARIAREATEKADREARERRIRQEAEARQAREAEEATLRIERNRIAEQERTARVEREKADTEARELRAKQETDEREARELEETRLKEEREQLEAEQKAEADRIEAQEKADREKAEAEEREEQRRRDELLDGRKLLETFVERYGEISEFVSVGNSIRSYLDRG